MFKVGDLVRRIKVLSVIGIDSEWVEYDNPAIDYGVIIDIEEPVNESKLLSLTYPEVFIKVFWQKNNFGAIWHWGDEIIVVKKADKG
jgi:hypothetical protein